MLSIQNAAPIVNHPLSEGGLPFFYDLQNGMVTPELAGVGYTFFTIVCFPFIYSFQPIHARINHFDYIIALRAQKNGIVNKWNSSYLVRILWTNFFYTFLFFFSILIVEVLVIQIAYQPFIFQKTSFFLTESITYYLSPNGLTNFVMYLLLAPLGSAIFSTFIMVVGLYIKNYFVYLSSGLLLSLILIIAPALIKMTLNTSALDPLLYAIEADSLLKPGLTTLGSVTPAFSATFAYLFSLIFFVLLIIILFHFRIKLDKKSS